MSAVLDQWSLEWAEDVLSEELKIRSGMTDEMAEAFKCGFRVGLMRLAVEIKKKEIPF